jgi:hypothetical protein
VHVRPVRSDLAIAWLSITTVSFIQSFLHQVKLPLKDFVMYSKSRIESQVEKSSHVTPRKKGELSGGERTQVKEANKR